MAWEIRKQWNRTKTEYLYCPFNDPQAPSPDLMLDSVILPHCKSFKLPAKLKGRLYTSVVRPALTDGQQHGHFKENTSRNLQQQKWRCYAWVQEWQNSTTSKAKTSLQVKEAVTEKLQHDRIRWFEKVHPQEQVTKKAINMNIPARKKRGAPKTSWLRQMKKRQQDHGLDDQEKKTRRTNVREIC